MGKPGWMGTANTGDTGPYEHQPDDLDEYEEWVHCESCIDGFVGHDCGEDCCPCLYPEDNVKCQICDGEGGWKPKPLDQK